MVDKVKQTGSRSEAGNAYRFRLTIIILATLLVAGGVFLLPPIAQDPAYFNFADQRTYLAIPNFFNVVSNIAFVAVGIYGAVLIGGKRCVSPLGRELSILYGIFTIGTLLTGLGSAYFHLHPTNVTLVWDRLPMTLGFMSFTAAMIAERTRLAIGIRLLPALLAVGLASVVYWYVGEQRGEGDLRLYALVQFYPLLLIPLLIALFNSRYSRSRDIFIALGIYLLAKACEMTDRQIFEMTGWVSGHTLKHLLAAVSVYWILRMLRLREPLPVLPVR